MPLPDSQPTSPMPHNDVKLEPDLQDESLKEEIWFDSRSEKYYALNDDCNWVAHSETTIKRHLKAKGYKASCSKDEKQSQIDSILNRIVNYWRVDFAGQLGGHAKGICFNNGRKILVTESPKLIKPTPGNWDTIRALLTGMFVCEEEGINQLPYFEAWMRDYVYCLNLGKNPRTGLCLALAGNPGTGKTLLISLVREAAGGVSASPYRHFTGRDNFSENLFLVSLLTIDDEVGDSHPKARKELGAAIKQVVAVGTLNCRGMYKVGMDLMPLWRLVICLNIEHDALMVLPPLERDIADKILLLKTYEHEMPMDSQDRGDQDKFFQQLKSELPHWLHYLRYESKTPKELQGRFGVKHWHHPEILHELDATAPFMKLHSFINRAVLNSRSFWEGSAEELEVLLKGADSPLSFREKERVRDPASIGKDLAILEKKFGTERYHQKRTKTKRFWIIRSENYQHEPNLPETSDIYPE